MNNSELNNFNDLEENSTDYLRYLFTAVKYWYLFAICTLIGLAVAYLVNRYTNKEYMSSASIVLQNTEKQVYQSALTEQGLGMFNTDLNVATELAQIRSIPILLETIKELDFQVKYSKVGNIKDREIYNDAPFRVIIDTSQNQPISTKFILKYIDKKSYQLSVKKTQSNFYDYNNAENTPNRWIPDFDTIATFGDTISNPNFKFLIRHKPEHIYFEYYKGEIYYFSFQDYHSLAYKSRQLLSLQKASSQGNVSNIIHLSYRSNHPQKNIAFLNKLIEVYSKFNLDKKNRISEKTIDFIDNQLMIINDSVENTGNRLQRFRSSNKIIDLSLKAGQIYERLQENEKMQADLSLKKQYYNSLKKYISENKNPVEVITPSSIGIEAPEISTLIAMLISKTTERSVLSKPKELENPYINKLNREIKNIKNNLIENIDYLLNSTEVLENRLTKQKKEIEKEINQLPQTERELFGIERLFKINNEIYTYLLEKRAEAQISMASNLPDVEVIEKARLTDTIKTKPKNKKNITTYSAIGFAIAALFVFLRVRLDQKIYNQEDIKKISNIPIIGHIPHSQKDSSKIMLDHPKSSIAEAFRSIRTNLQFFTQKESGQIILLTSSISSEGKSFNALNLASAYALFGEKTLLLGYDLRKPKLHKELDINNDKGLSTFLSNNSELNEVIQKTEIENLDVIASGPTPPNPVELIASDKNMSFLKEMQKKYAYIILDTPPIGIVTDAFLLMNKANANIFVTRQGVSLKPIFKTVIEDVQKNKIKNISILINDVQPKDSYGYGYKYGYGYRYGYGYGYKYGYGYYEEDKKHKKKSLIRRLIKRFS